MRVFENLVSILSVPLGIDIGDLFIDSTSGVLEGINGAVALDASLEEIMENLHFTRLLELVG